MIQIMKYLKITIEKKQKDDRHFVLPDLCFHCASPDTAYQYNLHNQHTSITEHLMSMGLGLLYSLLSAAKKPEIILTGWTCEPCYRILEYQEKAKNSFVPKWLLLMTLLFSLSALPLLIYPLSQLPIEYLVTMVIVIPFFSLFFLKRLSYRQLKKIIQEINPHFNKEMLIKEGCVSPIGLVVKKKNVRYKLTIKVAHLDYIQQFMKLNARNSILGYNDYVLQKIKHHYNCSYN